MSVTTVPAKNRRQHQRLTLNRPIVLLYDKHSIYATTTDFSEEGVGLIADLHPDLNSIIEIHFELPESNSENFQAFQFKAKVMHCIDYLQKHHIGLKLDIPTPRYLQFLQQLN